jgi:hypothetical protein
MLAAWVRETYFAARPAVQWGECATLNPAWLRAFQEAVTELNGIRRSDGFGFGLLAACLSETTLARVREVILEAQEGLRPLGCHPDESA